MRNKKGITLIALVITIVVLIILAGVAINLSVGENGIFKKAQDAREKYNVESIREKVEIGIMNQEIEEIALGNEITIEVVLQELLEEGIFESIDKESQIGNIDDYEVKLKYNEEQKVVIEYIRKATGIRMTYTLDPISYTNEEKVSILVTVKGNIKSVTKPDGLVIYLENNTVALNYQVTSNGTYTFVIEDEHGNKIEKNAIVDTIDRLLPNDFTITGEKTETGIKITGTTSDAEANEANVKSGMEKYEYYVKGPTDTEYTKHETGEIEKEEYGTYSVYVIAYDKAGNSKQSNSIEIIKAKPQVKKIHDYVNYGIDLDDNGDTTDDWQIFYIEEDENSEYYGATYIITDYFAPWKKIKTSLSLSEMISYADKHNKNYTYDILWNGTPTYTEITEDVRKVFKYDYRGTNTVGDVVTSKLLNSTAWEADLVTNELKTKGGMAIGGPTIQMWCDSWNKTYPNQKIIATMNENGYLYNGVVEPNFSSYPGFKQDAPNIYFPNVNSNFSSQHPMAGTVDSGWSIMVTYNRKYY